MEVLCMTVFEAGLIFCYMEGARSFAFSVEHLGLLMMVTLRK